MLILNPRRRRRKGRRRSSRSRYNPRRRRRSSRRSSPLILLRDTRGRIKKGGRRRKGSRSRHNPSAVSFVSRPLGNALSVRGWRRTATDGVQIATGYLAVNALGALENRIGLGRILGAVPAGIARNLAGYVVKAFNVGITAGIANVLRLGQGFRGNLRSGGVANIGISIVRDGLALAGAPGAELSTYLSDFTLYGAPGATLLRPYGGLNDFLTVSGAPSMGDEPSSPGLDPYGANELIYGGSGV